MKPLFKMKIPHWIVLEYSVSQNCFHVYSLADMIKSNMENAFHRGNNDYLPIAVFKDEMDAHLFSEMFKKALDEQNKIDVDKLINNILYDTNNE